MTSTTTPAGTAQRPTNEPIRRFPIRPPASVRFAAQAGRINAYGLGVPPRRLIADPVHASGVTDVGPFPAPFGPDSTRPTMERVA